MTSLCLEAQTLSANQILMTYLNPRLRYNYFQFGKPNIYRVGVLLPVLTLTTSP